MYSSVHRIATDEFDGNPDMNRLRPGSEIRAAISEPVAFRVAELPPGSIAAVDTPGGVIRDRLSFCSCRAQ